MCVYSVWVHVYCGVYVRACTHMLTYVHTGLHVCLWKSEVDTGYLLTILHIYVLRLTWPGTHRYLDQLLSYSVAASRAEIIGMCRSLWLSWRCWNCKPVLSGLHRKPFTNWTTSQPQHPHFKILISSKLRGNSGIKDWNWSHTSKKTEHDSQGHILLLWKTIAFYKTNNKVKFYVRTVRLGKDRIHSSCTLSLHYKKKLHLHMRDRCARRTHI